MSEEKLKFQFNHLKWGYDNPPPKWWQNFVLENGPESFREISKVAHVRYDSGITTIKFPSEEDFTIFLLRWA